MRSYELSPEDSLSYRRMLPEEKERFLSLLEHHSSFSEALKEFFQ